MYTLLLKNMFNRKCDILGVNINLPHVELDMCLWNMDAPGGNKVKLWQKSLSPTFWPAPPQGHGMSVKCEEPVDEATVQVWFKLYLLEN